MIGSSKLAVAVSCQKHELFLVRHHYTVILRILGFQIAPHLGSENTSSLATLIARSPWLSQGSHEKSVHTLLLPSDARHVEVRGAVWPFLGRCYWHVSPPRLPIRCPITTEPTHMSHEKNPNLLSMKYWMVNRDPYNGLL